MSLQPAAGGQTGSAICCSYLVAQIRLHRKTKEALRTGRSWDGPTEPGELSLLFSFDYFGSVTGTDGFLTTEFPVGNWSHSDAAFNH